MSYQSLTMSTDAPHSPASRLVCLDLMGWEGRKAESDSSQYRPLGDFQPRPVTYKRRYGMHRPGPTIEASQRLR